jgi:hypothetical protein
MPYEASLNRIKELCCRQLSRWVFPCGFGLSRLLFTFFFLQYVHSLDFIAPFPPQHRNKQMHGMADAELLYGCRCTRGGLVVDVEDPGATASPKRKHPKNRDYIPPFSPPCCPSIPPLPQSLSTAPRSSTRERTLLDAEWSAESAFFLDSGLRVRPGIGFGFVDKHVEGADEAGVGDAQV